MSIVLKAQATSYVDKRVGAGELRSRATLRNVAQLRRQQPLHLRRFWKLSCAQSLTGDNGAHAQKAQAKAQSCEGNMETAATSLFGICEACMLHGIYIHA